MKVAIITGPYHPLHNKLIEHLVKRSPRVEAYTFVQQLNHTQTDLKIWLEHQEEAVGFIIMPPHYCYSSPDRFGCLVPTIDLEGIVGPVIKAASRNSAKVILLSEAPARLHDAFRKLRVYDSDYGNNLHIMENAVREYEKGIVLCLPFLSTDPWILSEEVTKRDKPLVACEPDYLFSLADADEVAVIVGECLESGWFGLHQLGGSNQLLRLSEMVGHKDAPTVTYNYSLPSKGIVPPLKKSARDIWRELTK